MGDGKGMQIDSRNMSIKEFKDTLEIMRTAYNFDDETTRICGIRDLISGCNRKIELETIDKSTDTTIYMSRRVDGGDQ